MQIASPPQLAEATATAVTEATRRGVSIEERAEAVAITGYVKSRSAAEAAVGRLQVALAKLVAVTGDEPLAAPTLEPLPEEDWALSWRKHYHPLRVGERLVVKPRWEKWPPIDGSLPAYDDDIVIELDPQMAFGAGTHPSTQLCLQAAESLVRAGDVVADVGCGSGILSIAAARLGAAGVLAVDNDPVAAEIAADNARYNGVEQQVQVIIGDGLSGVSQCFHVILANINSATVSSLAGELASRLLPGGYLAASGIVDREADAQSAALTRAGLAVRRAETQQDWVCLIAQRPR